jgi:hypothetical protein
MKRLMKPGIKTTEFWLALLVAALGGLSAAYAESEWARVAGIIAAAIASLGYGSARARVKTEEKVQW